MTALNPTRHQSIFDPVGFNVPIHIIGAGATGSRLWLALVELGITNITVYDFDIVEEHNLANQIYLQSHIGMHKVDALKSYYQHKTGQHAPDEMKFVNARVKAETAKEHPMSGVVFLLTDTMSSRKEIFEHCLDGVAYMIETRMAAAHGNIFTINMFDDAQKQRWVDTLLDDDDPQIEASPCGTSISVGPTASLIANMAVWSFIQQMTMPDVVSEQVDAFFKPFLLSS